MKKLFFNLFTIMVILHTSLYAGGNSIKIQFGHQEMYDSFAPYNVPLIFITALDNVTIKKIVANKGQCKLKFLKEKLILMENRYQKTILKFPKKMHFSESFNFENNCDNLMRLDIYTDKGTVTWQDY